MSHELTKQERVIWATGFIDGEGSIQISRSNPTSPSVSITACQVNPKPLEELKKLFGGSVHYWKATYNGRKICEWQIKGYNAYLTAKELFPYSITKKQELDLLIDYMSLPWRSLRKKAGGTWIQRSEEQKCADSVYAEAMGQLKTSRKGKDKMSWQCKELFKSFGYSLPLAYNL